MRRIVAVVVLLILSAAFTLVGSNWDIGSPQAPLFAPAPLYAQVPTPSPDLACRLCHIGSDSTLTLSSGETIAADFDLDLLRNSVHGTHVSPAVTCTDCHRDIQRYQYPHAPNPAQTLGEFEAEIAGNCQRCHEPAELHNPGHEGAEDNPNLPTCVDCHGGHDGEPVAGLLADPVATCQSCHGEFDDPVQEALHAEVVPNLAAAQDCRSCHNGDPLYPADRQCRTCHLLVERELTLESGEMLSAHVDLTELAESVHGDFQRQRHNFSPLLCTDCHRDEPYQSFPHEIPPSPNLRTRFVDASAICAECHDEISHYNDDSVHAEARAEGKMDAATCIDCHGNHTIQPPDEPRERVEQTCGICHEDIHHQYEQSVHGAVLLGEHNTDVPVCTDCHGVHNIPNPRTNTFRINSPEMCGDCHADTDMMAKYGISTDVFETYVAEFHGNTVELFKKTSPDQETNKAVCYDCHGIHDILPANDEHSHVIKENLLVTCQQCHPDANANFPNTWTSHFKPSWEHNRLVYLVNWFYRIIIPAVIGGFMLFIGSDVFRRFRIRRKEK